jgi:hypothetical protein
MHNPALLRRPTMQKGTRAGRKRHLIFMSRRSLSLWMLSALALLQCSRCEISSRDGRAGFSAQKCKVSCRMKGNLLAVYKSTFMTPPSALPPPLFCHANKIQKLFRLNTGGAAFLKRAVMTADRRCIALDRDLWTRAF